MTISAQPLDSGQKFLAAGTYSYQTFEFDPGFILSTPVNPTGKGLPVFEWMIPVTVKGDSGDNCSKLEIGFVQLVLGFEGTVEWQFATAKRKDRPTIWRWSIDGLPVRDSIGGWAGPPWYKQPITVGKCGDTVAAYITDGPTLLRGQGQPEGYQAAAGGAGNEIPWTLARNGVTSATLTIRFATGLVQHDLTSGGFDLLRWVDWSIEIGATFDLSKSIGNRGKLRRQNILVPSSMKSVHIEKDPRFDKAFSGMQPAPHPRIRASLG
jgi:hypothetical protein